MQLDALAASITVKVFAMLDERIRNLARAEARWAMHEWAEEVAATAGVSALEEDPGGPDYPLPDVAPPGLDEVP